MENLPLFYKDVVPLDKQVHADLSVEPTTTYSHASETNSIYIAAIEFPRASREYPIVFAQAKDTVFPVALLGAKKSFNAYIKENGSWDATYVPAYVRRYPFILGTSEDNKDNFSVCIDQAYAGFNTDNKGTRLFDEKNEQTELTKNAVEFLKDYQTHVSLTSLFCKNLVEFGLLEPMQANIETNDGEKQSLGGFMGVNRDKLKSLDAEKLTTMLKTDQMELIFQHLASLNNIDKLLKVK